MKATTCISFLLLLVIHGSLQKSTPSSPTYRAAVVEFNPVYYEFDPERTMIENGAATVSYIEQAAEKNVDIIVFPEEGLQTVYHPVRKDLFPWSIEIPAPSRDYAACDSNDTSVREAVRMVACAAKRNKIYVAINVLEKENCLGKNCPTDRFYFFITSVVFDRDGIIISRYRKSHLNDDYGLFDFLNPPVKVTFNTDFGVTFGHIVCSDMMFKNPWIDVARELNITDFISEMAWDIKMPFISALQMQSGFSYVEDINLLAADYNSVQDGYSGSGIYAGRDGILTAIMTQGVHEEMLIADVPKKFEKTARPSALFSDSEGHVRLIDDNQGYQIRNASLRKNDGGPFHVQYKSLEAYETKLISDNGYVLEELSHGGIKCKFEVNVTNLNPPATYRLVAFDDKFSEGPIFTLGIRICSIVSCLNDTLSSCGLIHGSSTVFQSIAVTATYEQSENVIMTPNSLGSDLLPLRSWVFDKSREGDQEHTFMFLPKPAQDLIVFGVWGRNYDEDVMSSGRNISSELLSLPILVILLNKLLIYFL